MPRQITPFLMFTGQAEQAMAFYTSVFPDAAITDVERYGPDGPAPEGSVLRARFRLGEQEFLCTDSPPVHDFTFTPAFSIWVETESEAELEQTFATLSEGGAVLMPLDGYGFSRRFGWVNDRFGVSWQLNLA